MWKISFVNLSKYICKSKEFFDTQMKITMNVELLEIIKLGRVIEIMLEMYSLIFNIILFCKLKFI